MGMMGLMGGGGKGTPRWESRSGDFYRTGETRLQGRGILQDGGNRVTRKGKGIYQVGEKGEGGKKKNPSLVGKVRDFINL